MPDLKRCDISYLSKAKASRRGKIYTPAFLSVVILDQKQNGRRIYLSGRSQPVF